MENWETCSETWKDSEKMKSVNGAVNLRNSVSWVSMGSIIKGKIDNYFYQEVESKIWFSIRGLILYSIDSQVWDQNNETNRKQNF